MLIFTQILRRFTRTYLLFFLFNIVYMVLLQLYSLFLLLNMKNKLYELRILTFF